MSELEGVEVEGNLGGRRKRRRRLQKSLTVDDHRPAAACAHVYAKVQVR